MKCTMCDESLPDGDIYYYCVSCGRLEFCTKCCIMLHDNKFLGSHKLLLKTVGSATPRTPGLVTTTVAEIKQEVLTRTAEDLQRQCSSKKQNIVVVDREEPNLLHKPAEEKNYSFATEKSSEYLHADGGVPSPPASARRRLTAAYKGSSENNDHRSPLRQAPNSSASSASTSSSSSLYHNHHRNQYLKQ